ncbi:hypothetical protein ACIA7S_28715 [Streptomyces sp. NPDC051643]|uniref:hypothetical protein n=1 Tax=Streptomyces sp. NPDC051643 TaxID=3365665 RepID=UPI00378CAB2A
MSTTPDLSAIAREFTDTWAMGDGAREVAPSLQCVEASALARLFEAVGRPGTAEVWMAEHRDSDPECTCPGGEDESDDVAPEVLAEPCEGCGSEPGVPCDPHSICRRR